MKRKSNITRQLRAAVAAALLGGCFSLSPAAYALPVGGASSTAVIAVNGTTMNITGAANNLITWGDFSIASNETVAFDAHNYLNYVNGSSISSLLGTLTGGGTIYIVNPNGIHIGDGATIDVGTLHLSTADLTGHLDSFDSALTAMNGATTFAGDVVNKGSLKAAQTITVEGKNITFKNTANVTTPEAANVTLKSVGGEIHLGSTNRTGNYANTTGTKYLYKLVNTQEELNDIRNHLGDNYMLAGDIALTGSGYYNFVPIGSVGSGHGDANPYTGHFDGLGYKISNLIMNMETNTNWNSGPAHSTLGLFSSIGTGGVVENVGIESGSIYGNHSVGAIAGRNDGTVRNVYNKAAVTGGCNNVGGIVGVNFGLVERAYNTGTVTENTRYQVGGIVGYNVGTVQNAYNEGQVFWNGSSSGSVANSSVRGAGGIVGVNSESGKVLNTYNTGNIHANEGTYNSGWESQYGADAGEGFAAVGGIVGYAAAGTSIENSYNVGSVSSQHNEYVGGILGRGDGTVTNAYYKEAEYSNTAGTSRTDAQMKQAASFAGFNIDKNGSNPEAVWRIYEGNTMPLLTAFMTRKDSITEKKYDGTETVGIHLKASQRTSTQAEGINWVYDMLVVHPNPAFVPTPPANPTPSANPTLASADSLQATEQQMAKQGITFSRLEEATNAVMPNVQSQTATAVTMAPNAANRSANSTETKADTPNGDSNITSTLFWGSKGVLTVENKGINAPTSMSTESLAAAQSHNTAASSAEPAENRQSEGQSTATSENLQSDTGGNISDGNEGQESEENT